MHRSGLGRTGMIMIEAEHVHSSAGVYPTKHLSLPSPKQIFAEIYYNHPDMHPFGWGGFEHSLSDAQALFTKARDMGIYIHPWP